MRLAKFFQPSFSRRQRHDVRSPLRDRIYAIGDIHGRLDLFRALLRAIEEDAQARSPLTTRLVILGDFIDRGPDSSKIMAILAGQKSGRVVVLKGNHEAALLDALRGDHEAMDLWMAYGGDATLRSFGALDADLDLDDSRALIELARKIIPRRLVDWLAKLPVSYREGPYYFVHAGIRPGLALDRQSVEDQLWIREDFTESTIDHGAVIVHGHSINEAGVIFSDNRIGVDTGAYRTGLLCAVGLEADDKWVVTNHMGAPEPRTVVEADPPA